MRQLHVVIQLETLTAAWKRFFEFLFPLMSQKRFAFVWVGKFYLRGMTRKNWACWRRFKNARFCGITRVRILCTAISRLMHGLLLRRRCQKKVKMLTKKPYKTWRQACTVQQIKVPICVRWSDIAERIHAQLFNQNFEAKSKTPGLLWASSEPVSLRN